MMVRVFTGIMFMFFSYCINGQYLLGAHVEYDDSFREWKIDVEIDSTTIIEGSLALTWGLGDDFTQWSFSIGDMDGEINQKFKNNGSLWELKLENELVTIKQKWPKDPTQWKISMGRLSFTIRTTNGNILDQWKVSNRELGDFIVYSEYSGDARDWLVEDYMVDEIPFSMRLAAAFISIYTSSPKR